MPRLTVSERLPKWSTWLRIRLRNLAVVFPGALEVFRGLAFDAGEAEAVPVEEHPFAEVRGPERGGLVYVVPVEDCHFLGVGMLVLLVSVMWAAGFLEERTGVSKFVL